MRHAVEDVEAGRVGEGLELRLWQVFRLAHEVALGDAEVHLERLRVRVNRLLVPIFDHGRPSLFLAHAQPTWLVYLRLLQLLLLRRIHVILEGYCRAIRRGKGRLVPVDQVFLGLEIDRLLGEVHTSIETAQEQSTFVDSARFRVSHASINREDVKAGLLIEIFC